MKYEGPWFFPRLNSPELREEGKEIEFDVVMMPQMADESRPHRGWAEGVCVPKSPIWSTPLGTLSTLWVAKRARKSIRQSPAVFPTQQSLVENFWGPDN